MSRLTFSEETDGMGGEFGDGEVEDSIVDKGRPRSTETAKGREAEPEPSPGEQTKRSKNKRKVKLNPSRRLSAKRKREAGGVYDAVDVPESEGSESLSASASSSEAATGRGGRKQPQAQASEKQQQEGGGGEEMSTARRKRKRITSTSLARAPNGEPQAVFDDKVASGAYYMAGVHCRVLGGKLDKQDNKAYKQFLRETGGVWKGKVTVPVTHLLSPSADKNETTKFIELAARSAGWWTSRTEGEVAVIQFSWLTECKKRRQRQGEDAYIVFRHDFGSWTRPRADLLPRGAQTAAPPEGANGSGSEQSEGASGGEEGEGGDCSSVEEPVTREEGAHSPAAKKRRLDGEDDQGREEKAKMPVAPFPAPAAAAAPTAGQKGTGPAEFIGQESTQLVKDVAKERQLSSFALRFLSKRPKPVVLVPEIEQSRDDFLLAFGQDFADRKEADKAGRSERRRSERGVEGGERSESGWSSSSSGSGNSSSSSSSSSSDSDDDDDDDDCEDDSDMSLDESGDDLEGRRRKRKKKGKGKKGKEDEALFFVHNLPFDVCGEEQLRTKFRYHGKVTKVQVVAPKGGRPSGQAIITFATAADGERARAALNETEWKGRTIRMAPNSSRRSAGSSSKDNRYFVDPNMDLDGPGSRGGSSKLCHKCRMPGHMAANCPSAHEATCSLCARRGHVADRCPYHLCFNCWQQGHVAFKCPNKRIPQPMFCYQCGKAGHEPHTGRCNITSRSSSTSNCVSVTKRRRGSKKEANSEPKSNPRLRCLACGEMGHLCCVETVTRAEGDKAGDGSAYCFHCGGKGHDGYTCPQIRRRSGAGSGLMGRESSGLFSMGLTPQPPSSHRRYLDSRGRGSSSSAVGGGANGGRPARSVSGPSRADGQPSRWQQQQQQQHQAGNRFGQPPPQITFANAHSPFQQQFGSSVSPRITISRDASRGYHRTIDLGGGVPSGVPRGVPSRSQSAGALPGLPMQQQQQQQQQWLGQQQRQQQQQYTQQQYRAEQPQQQQRQAVQQYVSYQQHSQQGQQPRRGSSYHHSRGDRDKWGI